jgi:SAM-dependent methyltransferase
MIQKLLRSFRNRANPTIQLAAGVGVDMPVDPYCRELTDAEISADHHRAAVGGRWDELGQLQFEFLAQRGLRPEHRLLDVGCGALRGGVHFIRYLEPGNYHGIDRNASLVRAGETVEIPRAGVVGRHPRLVIDDKFTFERFGASFRFAIALSAFTHFTVNQIERCLVNMAKVLEPGGRFYATYFESPCRHQIQSLSHLDGIVTFSDADPFHYHFSLFAYLIQDLPLNVVNIGVWGHPRGQHMLEFVRV